MIRYIQVSNNYEQPSNGNNSLSSSTCLAQMVNKKHPLHLHQFLGIECILNLIKLERKIG